MSSLKSYRFSYHYRVKDAWACSTRILEKSLEFHCFSKALVRAILWPITSLICLNDHTAAFFRVFGSRLGYVACSIFFSFFFFFVTQGQWLHQCLEGGLTKVARMAWHVPCQPDGLTVPLTAGPAGHMSCESSWTWTRGQNKGDSTCHFVARRL